MLLVNQNNVVDAKSVNASLIALNKKIKQVEDKIAPNSKVVNNSNVNIFDVIYPIKSLYWTEDADFNPNKSFFGTWERVKGKFIYAANDNETIGTIGGSKKISTENLPTHNHSFTGSEHSHTFTPSGSVSSHTHGLNGHTHEFTPSGTVANHSHGLNGHTHTFTPSGTVASHNHGLNGHTHSMTHYHNRGTMEISGYFDRSSATNENLIAETGTTYGAFFCDASTLVTDSNESRRTIGNSSSNYKGWRKLKFLASKAWTGLTSNAVNESGGSVSTGGNSGNTTNTQPSFTGTQGTTGGNSGNTTSTQPTFTGTKGTTVGNSGNTTSTQPTFTGTQQTIKATASGTVGNTGSGVDYMPPYESAICWKRIA